MTIDLEPCPWCAAPGVFVDTDPGKPFGTFVMCKVDCDMCASTNWHETREGAAAQWNTRAPDSGRPHCQLCGGNVESWFCQTCEAEFHEVDGLLVLKSEVPAPDSGSLSPASGWPTREALVDLIDGEPAFIANVMDENRIWLARILTDKILASAPLPPANSKEPG